MGPVIAVFQDQPSGPRRRIAVPAIVTSDPSLRKMAQCSTAARLPPATGSPNQHRTGSSSPKAYRRYSNAVMASRNGCDR
jgi:hypothetical protein